MWNRELPSAGSVIDIFNLQLLDQCVNSVRLALQEDSLGRLPVAEATLLAHATAAGAAANATFERERFGDGGLASIELGQQIARLVSQRQESNRFASLQACDAVAADCDAAMLDVTGQFLLSKRKFEQNFHLQCNESYALRCVGPSRVKFGSRIERTWVRLRAQFDKDYNGRILSVLVCAAVFGAIFFRFVAIHAGLELVCWICLAVLELGPRLSLVSNKSQLYDSSESTKQKCFSKIVIWRLLSCCMVAITLSRLRNHNLRLVALGHLGLRGNSLQSGLRFERARACRDNAWSLRRADRNI
eukprot:SAG31_NODE_3269_length_4478_cov_2.680521_5_plen_302_part_00